MTSFWTLEHCPGPSEEAKRLQLDQYLKCDAMYDAWNDALKEVGHDKRDAAGQNPAYIAAKKAYDDTVVALQALLGPEAHCNHVDADLWSLYSDCYKDKNNIRPRWHHTRQQVIEWLDGN